MIRGLKSVVETEQAVIGLFITLTPPTKGMVNMALKFGYYNPGLSQHKDLIPIIQILTIEELLRGATAKIPGVMKEPFRKPPRRLKGEQPTQESLL